MNYNTMGTVFHLFFLIVTLSAALAFTQNKSTELGSTYCMENPTSQSADTLEIPHKGSLILDYNGWAWPGGGGYCSVIYTYPGGFTTDKWEICAKPLIFNISACGVVVDYTEFFIAANHPDKEIKCDTTKSEQMADFCTTKDHLRVGIEANKDTDSKITWLITAVNKSLSGCQRVHLSGWLYVLGLIMAVITQRLLH